MKNPHQDDEGRNISATTSETTNSGSSNKRLPSAVMKIPQQDDEGMNISATTSETTNYESSNKSRTPAVMKNPQQDDEGRNISATTSETTNYESNNKRLPPAVMKNSQQDEQGRNIYATTSETTNYVRFSFTWMWRRFLGLLRSLLALICLLRYINFLPHLSSVLGGIVYKDTELRFCPIESAVYPPPLRERFVNLFKSEHSKRQSLLAWIRQTIPDQDVADFNCSWCSGVALCALAEATNPGTCPRYDILAPEQALNNCRLSMKLIRRSFGIFEPLDPDNMSNPGYDSEDQLVPYLEMIRYASMVPRETSKPMPRLAPTDEMESKIPDIQECLATGSGLVTAIAGRKAKINITKPLFFNKKLVVEIKGPNGEHVRRLIEDMKSAKDLEGILTNSPRSWQRATGAIVFDHQKIKDGHYQISYIPPTHGRYTLSVLWGGEHTTNSPYSVNVLPNDSKSATRPIFKKSVSFSSNSTDRSVHSASPSPVGANRPRRHSLCRQAHVSSKKWTSTSTGSIMADADLSDKPSSLLASYERHEPSPDFSRSGSVLSSSTDHKAQPRVRRRVIKRVVKGPNGKDEVYYPSSTDRSIPEVSRSASSLSMSLSVSYDDCLSSRSPSPVVLAPAPTLQTLERQIQRYASRCAAQILCSAFYEMSREVAFAMAEREPQTESAKDDSDNKGYSSPETQDTINSSFTDGLSIHTDSMADDVFESSRTTSCESKQNGGAEHNIWSHLEDSISSLHRYPDPFRRPRYESETFFKPISSNSSDIPRFERNRKMRSRSESDNLTSADSKNDRESIPSSFSCFKPVTRKHEGRREENDDHETSPESDFNHTRTRHPKLRSRRRASKNVDHQETQCSAEEIKRVTGWVNRRERLRSVHQMKEVESKNFPPSNDETTNSTIDREQQKGHRDTEDLAMERNPPNAELAVTNDSIDVRKTRAASEPSGNEVERPQMQPRSRSFAKQSTFDSGYSDENGQNSTTHPVRNEHNSENVTSGLVRRLDGDIETQVRTLNNCVDEENSVGTKPLCDPEITLSVEKDETECNDGLKTEVIVDYNMDTSSDINSISVFAGPKDAVNGYLPRGIFHGKSDLSDTSSQPFAYYWEDLIYHLENDPKFPVQEFISRVKNISMDIDSRNLIEGASHQGSNLTTDMLMDKVNHNDCDLRIIEGGSQDNSPLNSPGGRSKAGYCRAQGCGLQSGIVGCKNNFQVRTEGTGDGSVGVSIRGPRRHSVTECSVIYTGDDLYEVIYDVSLAGVYVISVKWADKHIIDSPFIVKVSF